MILKRTVLSWALIVGLTSAGAAVLAQGFGTRADIWAIELGASVRDLPVREFQEYACGSNGGPPRKPIAGFADYETCAPDGSGHHEVTFRYDDEFEYRARAIRSERMLGRYEGTRVFGNPVIISVLIDSAGRVAGVRIVSDPRASLVQREKAYSIRSNLRSRYASQGWDCVDREPSERQRPIGRIFVNQVCTKDLEDRQLFLEAHYFRKPGQGNTDPATRELTPGQFESSIRFEMYWTGDDDPG